MSLHVTSRCKHTTYMFTATQIKELNSKNLETPNWILHQIVKIWRIGKATLKYSGALEQVLIYGDTQWDKAKVCYTHVQSLCSLARLQRISFFVWKLRVHCHLSFTSYTKLSVPVGYDVVLIYNRFPTFIENSFVSDFGYKFPQK